MHACRGRRLARPRQSHQNCHPSLIDLQIAKFLTVGRAKFVMVAGKTRLKGGQTLRDKLMRGALARVKVGFEGVELGLGRTEEVDGRAGWEITRTDSGMRDRGSCMTGW